MTSRWPIHPVIVALLLALVGFAALEQLHPVKRRAPGDPLPRVGGEVSRPRPVRPEPSLPLAPAEPVALFDEWFRDVGTLDTCGFDLALSSPPRFELSLAELGGAWPQLGTMDLLFLAWVSHVYQIGPHFLLGIMQAESGGDCSAVSVAGAQGCFQITDTMGAAQLANSYPDRVADWYWARRRLTRTSGSPWPPEGRTQDYYPSDLFVSPEDYFQAYQPPPGHRRGRRQLRRLVDPVATQLRSDTWGEVPVSSIASFSFGSVGSALYFYWLGHLLYAQVGLYEEIRSALGEVPGRKALWMAASYNQGGPGSVRGLMRRREGFFASLRPEVAEYTRRVTDACVTLQRGEPLPPMTITWGVFSDFLQELRWTYSAVPIDWEKLREVVKAGWFTSGAIQLADAPAVFDSMTRWESRLGPEDPVLDFRMGWEER